MESLAVSWEVFYFIYLEKLLVKKWEYLINTTINIQFHHVNTDPQLSRTCY